jgi:hypothetical protein
VTSDDHGLSGGCQCGAVRFHVGRIKKSTVCHCRMCQKAFGSYFGPLVMTDDVTWTRGEPKFFRSSNLARRGFCAECGTPLCYLEDEGGIEVAGGAFDDPAAVAPALQINVGSRLPFYDTLPSVPHHNRVDLETQFNATVVNYQHPDRDTADWSPIVGEEK